jgi:ferredoxin-NADP reductase
MDAACEDVTAVAAFGPTGAAAGMQLRVVRVSPETPDILVVDLAGPDSGDLPAWGPGAHIDLVLPSGKVRQYSLCGDPADLTHYRVAVLHETAGRGGSSEIHASLSAGDTLSVRGPRNHFELVDAERYLLIAGGIGITPILPMLRAAERAPRPWQLVYGGRSRASMGFLAELKGRQGGECHLLPQDECGLPDFDSLLNKLEPGTAIYGCGPGGMLAALQAAADRHGWSDALHIERFSAPEEVMPVPESAARAFEVELRRSGKILQVAADQSLANVLQDADIPVTFSCQEGYCGSCETRVLEGVPDHRDTILNDQEKEEGHIMMVCVGRARSPRLVLDL